MSPAPPTTPGTITGSNSPFSMSEIEGIETGPEGDFVWPGIRKATLRVLLGLVVVPVGVALAFPALVFYLFYLAGDLALGMLRGEGGMRA